MDLDLDLDIIPRTRGRAPSRVSAVFVRDLAPADLALLETERGVKPQTIKKLRDTHHSIARALALGMKDAEVSVVTGYSPSRISILKNDPAFQELLAFYRENADAAFADLQERMSTLSLDAVEELRERMESAPETFTNTALLELVKTFADRTGHGPTTKSVTATVNFDISRLAKGRARAGLIESKPVVLAPPPDRGNLDQGELPL